jgi:hypothetical protein
MFDGLSLLLAERLAQSKARQYRQEAETARLVRYTRHSATPNPFRPASLQALLAAFGFNQ